MSASFLVLATVSCNTKRATVSGGLRGAPALNVIGLTCTPLDPVGEGELQTRPGSGAPLRLFQTFIAGSPDIVEGDVLAIGSTDYAIRAVGDWGAGLTSPAYKRLVVEELKL